MHAYTIQEKGGTMKAVREGIARIEAILPEANKVKRETVPASHLILGLQCGGSDGYSGISANPALGAAVDLSSEWRNGDSLRDTGNLRRRAPADPPGGFERGRGKIDRADPLREEYTARNRMEMNNNPSPGNKAGGLTTILEKSLGAVAKGGTTNLVAVHEYAEPVAKGFVYMDTPGYDPVSATGQVAGGANMICFTTGRGWPTAAAGASLKLRHHAALRAPGRGHGFHLRHGSSTAPRPSPHGRALLPADPETASGRKSKSEEFGYGDDEFAPWVVGATTVGACYFST